MVNSDIAVNCIKNIISNNDIEEESTLKIMIESIKKIQLKEQKDSSFKILNMKKINHLITLMIN